MDDSSIRHSAVRALVAWQNCPACMSLDYKFCDFSYHFYILIWPFFNLLSFAHSDLISTFLYNIVGHIKIISNVASHFSLCAALVFTDAVP